MQQEQAKNIDNNLAERLERVTETIEWGPHRHFSDCRPAYTPETILEIVRASKTDKNLAVDLEQHLKGSALQKHSATSLFDLSSSKPKVFDIVKRFAKKDAVEGEHVLRSLKHVPAEQVKYMPTKSVVMIENAAKTDKKAVLNILDDEFYKKTVLNCDNILSLGDEYGKFVNLAVKKPEETKKLVTKLEQVRSSLEKDKSANGNTVASKLYTDNVCKIVELYHAEPTKVMSIIEKFGFYQAKDIKVVLEFEQQGKNVDKYVREYLRNHSYHKHEGYNADNMKQYINFRLKTGSLYDKMITHKSEEEAAMFYENQLKQAGNDISSLERIHRDGRVPNNQEELRIMLDLYNKNPDTKVTDDMVESYLSRSIK